MITFEANLSTASIDSLIKDLEKYRKNLSSIMLEIHKALAEYAYNEIMNRVPVDYGDLQSSFVKEFTSEYARVFTENEYAKYVEFGTGIVGRDFSNPMADEYGWKYDINSHGEQGWYYYTKDGYRRWTKGQKAARFMYETMQYIQNNWVIIVRNILKEKGMI